MVTHHEDLVLHVLHHGLPSRVRYAIPGTRRRLADHSRVVSLESHSDPAEYTICDGTHSSQWLYGKTQPSG